MFVTHDLNLVTDRPLVFTFIVFLCVCIDNYHQQSKYNF